MKKANHDWPEDPVVAEVRAARQKLWRQAGETIKGLLKLLDEHVPATKPGPARRPARRPRSGASLEGDTK